MFTITIFYLAISIISACILAYFMRTAPVGWEDEKGFHVDIKPNIKPKRP